MQAQADREVALRLQRQEMNGADDRYLAEKSAVTTALQLQKFNQEDARRQELEEESRRAALALNEKFAKESKQLLAQRLQAEVCA